MIVNHIRCVFYETMKPFSYKAFQLLLITKVINHICVLLGKLGFSGRGNPYSTTREKGGYKELQYKELRQRITIVGFAQHFYSKDNIYRKDNYDK
ncbi:hypothetical protein DKP85_03180 [Bacillus thuringiensis]|nr:hypothetical protein [Bacillus toyonensis biovar Thuringiensis]